MRVRPSLLFLGLTTLGALACTAVLGLRDSVEGVAGDAATGDASPLDETGIPLDGSCGNVAPARRVGAYVVLLLDATTSMVADNRFEGERQGVAAMLTTLAQRNDPLLAVTLYFFGGSSHGGGPHVVSPPVLLTPASLGQLTGIISKESIASGTPVAPVVQAALATLKSFIPAPPTAPNGARTVILFVDNFIDTTADLSNLNNALHTASTDVVNPIDTYVVGLPQSGGDAQLSAAIALAGQTARGGCNLLATKPPYCFFSPPIPVVDGGVDGTLDAIFDELLCRVDVEGWTYDLDAGAIDAGDASIVYPIVFDGGSRGIDLQATKDGKTVSIPYDPANGWTYGRHGRIQLHGETCASISAATGVQLSVRSCP